MTPGGKEFRRTPFSNFQVVNKNSGFSVIARAVLIPSADSKGKKQKYLEAPKAN
jgi:hypothetical protein